MYVIEEVKIKEYPDSPEIVYEHLDFPYTFTPFDNEGFPEPKKEYVQAQRLIYNNEEYILGFTEEVKNSVVGLIWEAFKTLNNYDSENKN